jgi:hypothetical protein
MTQNSPSSLRVKSLNPYVQATLLSIGADSMNFALDWQSPQDDILRGIRAELAESSQSLDFVVRKRESEGSVWKVFVDIRQTNDSPTALDESLEGMSAWWAGPPKGRAEVLSVDAETGQINLRSATSAPPLPGERIKIYPPPYLEALLNCWSLNEWAKHCLEWFDTVTTVRHERKGPRRAQCV